MAANASTFFATATISRAAEPMCAQMGDDLVMLSLEKGKYFSLNASGAAVWQLLETPRTFAGLCGELCRTFDVEPATCSRDVAGLLEELYRYGLVAVTESDDGGDE